MTTEIQIETITPKHSDNNSASSKRVGPLTKMSTKLEECKGNVIRPLSLRPNRSVKKNISLKPLGLRSR